MKHVFKFFIVLCIVFSAPVIFAQDVQTRGSIGGQVTDSVGAAVPGATVRITGGSTDRAVTTNDQGLYALENLNPGVYRIRVEKEGFKAAEVGNVTVYVGKQATTNISLEVGNISEVVNVVAGAGIEQASTAVSSNLNDQLFNNIPVQRGVASLFYLAPGTTDSLGGGTSNPSISGGSALDNLYVADGVNITDSAFGGLGTFSRSYGSLGTGILTSFVKEVQVKTAGFEPQYGQSEGGIVNIITQSGGNEFRGAVYGYARPKAFEATRKQPDDLKVNKVGKLLHVENYDAGADLGGPIVKNRLFFFGSFNPTVSRQIFLGAQRNANDIATGKGLDSGLFRLLGEHAGRTRTLNYAGKIDWNISPNHTLSYSIFGDPNKTNKSSWASLNIDNATAQSVLDYGTRNQSVRYNGTFTPTWSLSVAFSRNDNHFNETGFDDFNQIIDRTGPNGRGAFTAVGRGFIEPTKGKTTRFTADTQKIVSLWGNHTFAIGYQFQRGNYSGLRDRSGPHYTVPATNATGNLTISSIAVGQPLNATWDLLLANSDCTLCPLMTIPGKGDRRVILRQTRGEFGVPKFSTFSNYHAYYAQDTWRFNKYITANYGLRGEQERIVGNPKNGNRVGYSFTDQWAPRVGVTVDPFGRGKTKAYYNFGRFFEYIPLDLAERSLSTELDFLNGRFIPAFTVDSGGERRVVLNEFGTVIPVVDAAHLISRVTAGSGFDACTAADGSGIPCSGPSVSAQDPSNPILPGTKLGFAQEHVIGFEQQLPKGFVMSVRYIDRRLKRIVEDAAVVSPEGIDFFGQTYFIGNIRASLDAAVNPISHVFNAIFDADGNVTNLPAACDPDLVNPTVTDSAGNVVGSVCWEANGKNGQPAGNPGADGVTDGFPDPVHNYKALEIELNKRFSNNWQLFSNWRIASLRGNFEGHFRNDNGQTDPAISSLFDFTAGDFNLLGDQFSVGPLNTDRRHVINVFGNYQFSKGSSFANRVRGLNLGLNFHLETGVPISEFLAHPAYLNAGEIPSGGRGKLGRTKTYPRFDFHADYPWTLTERVKLKFVGDLFNVFNTRTIRLPDQRRQLTVGFNNVDFSLPNSYYLPFNMRLGVRLEF